MEPQLPGSYFLNSDRYTDTNDADRLHIDPVMRKVINDKKSDRVGASTSQMGRFEAEVLTLPENLTALTHLSGQWIDRVNIWEMSGKRYGGARHQDKKEYIVDRLI
jgi:hypothetical protein